MSKPAATPKPRAKPQSPWAFLKGFKLVGVKIDGPLATVTLRKTPRGNKQPTTT